MVKTLRLFFGALLIAATAATARASEDFPWEIVRLDMKSESAGWALAAGKGGYGILRTSDGGATWADVSPDLLRDNRTEILPGLGGDNDRIATWFFDGESAWVAMVLWGETRSRIHLRQTRDAGKTWRESLIEPEKVTTAHFHFLDPRHGFLLAVWDPAAGGHTGEQVLYATTNGGGSWQARVDGFKSDQGIGSGTRPDGFAFRKETDGWVTGPNYAEPLPFSRTRDGGRTWEKQELPIEEIGGNTHPPAFCGPEKEVGVFPVGTHHGVVLCLSEDGGDSWRIVGAPGDLSTTFCALNADHWFAFSNNGHRFYKTADRGARWQATVMPREMLPYYDERPEPVALDFITPQAGWAVVLGRESDSDLQRRREQDYNEMLRPGRSQVLLRTTDGAAHWERLSPREQTPEAEK